MAVINCENICLYNKFEYCKYKEKCKYRHIKENCERTGCEGGNCIQRHPRKCSYYHLYKQCKFNDYCSFKHENNWTETVNNVRDIDKRIEEFDEKIIELKEIIVKQEETIDSLKKSIDDKTKDYRDLETKVDHSLGSLEQSIKSKVLELSHFIIENTVKALTAEFEKKQSDIEKT